MLFVAVAIHPTTAGRSRDDPVAKSVLILTWGRLHLDRGRVQLEKRGDAYRRRFHHGSSPDMTGS
jgi:hypothetical protein